MLHNMMNKVESGKIISAKRKEQQLTQQALADRAGVSRRTLIKLVHGRNDLCVRLLLRIVASVGLELDLRPASRRPIEDQLSEIFLRKINP